MQNQAPSVSHLVDQIKHILEGEFTMTSVMGEISNLSPSSAGHYYFTLSDEKASISCALFKVDALRNPLIKTLKDGDKVILTGPVSVYTKRGTFQLLAKRIYPAGMGDLKIQFERLKQKYMGLGYCDPALKKQIPPFPKRIAVITAIHGAALQDFLNIMYRRSLWTDILIIPAIVQGDRSALSIKEAIEKAQKISDIEVIVVTRGGGSMEDLWSFNDPLVVEAIYQCEIPLISAVGHQVDYTLCDYVADFRSETPSAAAEILSQPHTLFEKKLSGLGRSLSIYAKETQFLLEKKLERVHPRKLLEALSEKFHSLSKKLEKLKLENRLYELTRIHEINQQIDELKNRLTYSYEKKIQVEANKLEILNRALMSVNPKNVLKRGYAFVTNRDGKILKNAESIIKSKDTKFKITFSDGEVELIKGEV